MTIESFINYLNELKPTDAEIVKSLDEYDEDLVAGIIEMFNYRGNDKVVNYDSVILDCIYNTNVYEKGLEDFYFVSTLDDDNFAYTGDDHYFYIEGGNVYLKYENEYKLISTSQADFLHGLLCCFRVNIDFEFRKPDFDLDQCLLELVDKVPSSNSDYFVARLRSMYE